LGPLTAVSDTPLTKPVVRRAAFVIGEAQRRQFCNVLDYIEMQHWHIDPDMYRIELEEVLALKRRFQDDEEDPPDVVCMSFTHAEIFSLSTFVDAATTYSHRHKQPPVYGVNDQQLKALDEWIARAERWFITPLRET
jgi:hypothetical protein